MSRRAERDGPTQAVVNHGAFWEDRHANVGALSGVGHPGLGEGFNRVGYEIRLLAARKALAGAGVRQVRKVLEGAVGTGIYGRLWQQLGARAWTGVDISPTAIEVVRRRWPEGHFVVADLASKRFGGDAIPRENDLVTGIDVLFHVLLDDDFRTALRNLGDRVATGGALLLSGVFNDREAHVAPHVRHRGIEAHDRVLTDMGLTLAARQQVFAVLDDPVVDDRQRLGDRFAKLSWRCLSGGLKVAPGPLRSPLGAVAGRALAPIDAALCRSQRFRGVNLEFAVYRRQHVA